MFPSSVKGKPAVLSKYKAIHSDPEASMRWHKSIASGSKGYQVWSNDSKIMNIEKFLSSKAFGVFGVSKDRNRYGNKVLRCYLQNGKKVYPVHVREKNIEGIDCLEKIEDLPSEVESLSIITPPQVTEEYVKHAIAHGIKNIWMQPGAESQKAVDDCLSNNINVIYGGPCLLVALGFHD